MISRRTRRRVLGLAVVVIGLAGAITGAGTAAATTTLPELGRCVAATGTVEGTKTVYHGAYTNHNCTGHAGRGHGKYEWAPGPGAKNKFFGTALEPEPVLETTGGAKVTCSSMSVKGEYTGAKTAKLSKVLFAGCESPAGSPCQSNPAKEGEIEGSGEFAMELGKVAGTTKPTAGWDLKREGVAFLYTCGKAPEIKSVQKIEGSVIAPLARGLEYDVNRMNIKALMKYKAPGAKQLPEAFEGGANDTLTTKTTTTGSLTEKTEQTGLTTNLELESGLGESGIENPENQEPLEVKVS